MSFASVQALPPGEAGSAASRVHDYLRSLVLNGTLEPGVEFSQVVLARVLGVSRTPVREALRMLQEEGLVEAEPNLKARVTSFSAAELDVVYASRVAMESVAVSMTARLRSSELVAELETMLDEMEQLAAVEHIDDFQAVHRRFHRLLVSGAPRMFRDSVCLQQDRAERYWRLLNIAEPAPHSRRDREHREIVAAVRAQDEYTAATALARHLARTALALITYMAPEEDTPSVRTALRLLTRETAAAR